MLKIPLDAKSWIDEESLVIVRVIYKVITNLTLCSNAEMFRSIKPELGFGENN